jgi:hypothetical protein
MDSSAAQPADLPAPGLSAADDPLRQLARLGIDVRQLGGQELPSAAWEVIYNVVRHIRGKNRRWYAAASMFGRFDKVLRSGGSLETLTAQFAAGKSLAPLMADTALREPVLAADLPGPLNHWLASVVRRTKLRTSEKIGVVEEVIGQCRERLARGQNVTEILDDLGPPRAAARQFRRAALRRRSWWWHACRWSLRAAAFLFISVLITASWLLYRFHSVRPVDSGDPIERLDTIASAVPPAERAWPDYVEGLAKIDLPKPTDAPQWQRWSAIQDACTAGTAHAEWQEAVKFLNSNRAAVDDFLRGAAKPRLGFVRRDPLNDRWLMKLNQGSVAQAFRKPASPMALILPESTALHYMQAILAGSAHLAVEQGDWPRAVSCLTALVGLGRQVFDEEDFAVMRLIALHGYDGAVTSLASILAAHRETAEDAALQEAVTALSTWDPNWQRRMLQSEAAQQHELLTLLYSEDGRFTGEGLKLLFAAVGNSNSQIKWLTDLLGQSIPGSAASRGLRLNLIGPLIVPFVGDRDEMAQTAERLDQLFAADIMQADVAAGGAPARNQYDQEIDSLAATRWSQIRYLPVIAGQRSAWIRSGFDSRRNKWAQRDAVLIVAAAELYRRHNGAWPESSAALAPEFLKTVPLDPYDGQPLRLVILKDQPVVYSAGLDQRDNSADTLKPRSTEIDDRDWQLFPPLKADPPPAR